MKDLVNDLVWKVNIYLNLNFRKHFLDRLGYFQQALYYRKLNSFCVRQLKENIKIPMTPQIP